MLKLVLLFLALYSFFVDAKYSYEFYKGGRETLKSRNVGDKPVKKIKLCYASKEYNVRIEFDCDISEGSYELYTKLSLEAFSKLRKAIEKSPIYSFYSISERSYCIIFVDKLKYYEFEVEISPCVTIYIAVESVFNGNSKYSVASGIAALTHEDFHILHSPFKRNSGINGLLVNEYAASLITLNSYRILNKALNIPFEGRWSNLLAEKFLHNENMDNYCANFSGLREKNIKLGTNFDSVMGGIFAHIFANNVVKDSTLLSLYISEEINSLFSKNVTEDMLLPRLGLCGKPAVIHENVTKALLPDMGMGNEFFELFGYNYSILSSRNYSQDEIENICANAVYKNSCRSAYIKNANLSDDGQLNIIESFIPDSNGKSEISIDENLRYFDEDINIVIDTGASSNVFSKEKFPCITDDVKNVKTLYGEDKNVFKCAYNYPIGEIWVKDDQEDNVLSLR